MIEVERLCKRYEGIDAVRDVGFRVEPGTIFGLLGPNGAGKSTTIGCISGLIKPSSGSVTIMGHDVATAGAASRARMGVVPQELALYLELSARENLRFWGSAYGLRGAPLRTAVQRVLGEIGLLDRADEPVQRFSGGMQRRLNFGCAMVHAPAVLLLDEPTVGVDPQSRERLLELVRDQAAAGACVLYTTHYMQEAETLCGQLLIIDHGSTVAAGTLQELRGMLGERDIVTLRGRFVAEAVRAGIGAGPEGLELLSVDEQQLEMTLAEAPRHLPQLLRLVADAGGDITETTVARPSLETLFMKLTGRALRA